MLQTVICLMYYFVFSSLINFDLMGFSNLLDLIDDFLLMDVKRPIFTFNPAIGYIDVKVYL